LIECDLALAVCARLLTIEIFFTGNRHCLFFKQSAGKAARSGMRSSPGCARVPKIPAGPILRPNRDIQTVSPRASYRPQRRAFYPPGPSMRTERALMCSYASIASKRLPFRVKNTNGVATRERWELICFARAPPPAKSCPNSARSLLKTASAARNSSHAFPSFDNCPATR
jgi:hypothetical protein